MPGRGWVIKGDIDFKPWVVQGDIDFKPWVVHKKPTKNRWFLLPFFYMKIA
jgi:hypothetical protein